MEEERYKKEEGQRSRKRAEIEAEKAGKEEVEEGRSG